MAAIASAASGNWSAGGTWVGGVAPTGADDAVIANTHTVTLNATGCVAKSVTINSGGTLTNITAASWDLTVGNVTGDTINIVLNSGGTINLDMSAAPNYTGTVYLNKGNNAAGLGIQSSGTATFSLKGAARKRWTRLNGAIAAGATSALVDDASGWRVGDRIIFGTTQPYNATPRIDEVILTSVSGANIGWTGGITYDHADNGYVGNFSSNLTVRPFGTNRSYVAADNNGARTIHDVAFDGLGGTVFAKYGLSLNNGNATVAEIKNNAFYSTHAAQTALVFLRFLAGFVTRQDNVFYCTTGNVFGGQSTDRSVGDWERAIVFRSAGSGLMPVNAGEQFIDSVAMACSTGAFAVGGFGNKFINCSGFSSNQAVYSASGGGTYLELDNCDLGAEFGASNGTVFNLGGAARVVTRDCIVQSGGTFATGIPSGTKQSFVGADLTNRDDDVTKQESYYPLCEIKRDNSNTNRSTSSIAIQPTVVSTNATRTLTIPCANGASIRIVGYVKKSHATNIAATVAITGLGSSVTPFTKANDTEWEKFDLTATNSSGADGNFTLTYTANSSSGTTNVAYFDGVSDAPFVTKCRHYGFLFDESSPVRTIDPYTVASEATAAAYTGVTINGATKRITFGAGTADTAQKFYDYTRAWCCTNLAQPVPFTRAGALLALAAGWTVEEPTYSGVTWGGGNIEWDSPGSKSGAFDSCDWTFTVAGTYSFGTATLAGTIELINTSGGAVTVQLPAGASYTNTGPNITVEVAVEQADALISGIVAGSRLQIYNVTTATEMVNAINATTSYTASYDNGTGYTAGDIVRVRLTWCDGLDAKLPAEYFTIATSSGWSVLADQEPDEVYVANGIDGSTVTEYSSDYVNVQIDISDPDGTTSIQRGYAWYCDQITGDDGIRYFFGAFVAEDAFNYLLDTDVADIKIQNTGGSGVTLTGGAVRRKDGISPIAPGGSVYIYYGRTYALETGVSGLTPSESNALNSAASKISTVEKIQRNKMITDPSTGVLTVFDDDGVTPLLTANIFKDAAGTQPYRGTGAERRERLE